MFNRLFKRLELLDREMELFKKERQLAVDIEIEAYRAKRQKEVEVIAQASLEQLAKYEHEFHQTKETRGIELAKLESKIEALKLSVAAREEVVAADNNLLKAKNNEIERLNTLLTTLINKQPATIQIQNSKC
jgi:hypothetical protein